MKPWTGKSLPKGYEDVMVRVQFANGVIAHRGEPTPAKSWRWEKSGSEWDIVAYERVEGME